MGFWNSKNESEKVDSDNKVAATEMTSIDFGEVLDISFAAKFHAQLKDEIENNSTVKFITSELTRIDASCLQILASFMNYAKENEISIQWDAPNDVLKEATRLTGFSDLLRTK